MEHRFYSATELGDLARSLVLQVRSEGIVEAALPGNVLGRVGFKKERIGMWSDVVLQKDLYDQLVALVGECHVKQRI